jgi:hypothetical protein
MPAEILDGNLPNQSAQAWDIGGRLHSFVGSVKHLAGMAIGLQSPWEEMGIGAIFSEAEVRASQTDGVYFAESPEEAAARAEAQAKIEQAQREQAELDRAMAAQAEREEAVRQAAEAARKAREAPRPN